MRTLAAVKAGITSRRKDGPAKNMKVYIDGDAIMIELPAKGRPWTPDDLTAWRWMVRDLDNILTADSDIKSHEIDTPFEVVHELGEVMAYAVLRVKFYTVF